MRNDCWVTIFRITVCDQERRWDEKENEKSDGERRRILVGTAIWESDWIKGAGANCIYSKVRVR